MHALSTEQLGEMHSSDLGEESAVTVEVDGHQSERHDELDSLDHGVGLLLLLLLHVPQEVIQSPVGGGVTRTHLQHQKTSTCTSIHNTYTYAYKYGTNNTHSTICILVRRKIKEKSVHTSVLEAQFTDVCTGHQTGFIVGINCVRTRQEINKHISIAYNMLYWTMRIFPV